MRPSLLTLGPLGICLTLSSLAIAQEPLPLMPAPTTPAPWEIALPQGIPTVAPATVVPEEPRPLFERNPLFDVDVLLGVPIAGRVGLAVFRHEEQAVLLEVMAGLDFLIVPFVAAGARYRFVAWHTQRSELVLKPGVDAYAGVIPLFFAIPFVGVGGDVACVFLHNGPLHGWEWGLDLGAIALINGGARGVVPIASIIVGFNF